MINNSFSYISIYSKAVITKILTYLLDEMKVSYQLSRDRLLYFRHITSRYISKLVSINSISPNLVLATAPALISIGLLDFTYSFHPTRICTISFLVCFTRICTFQF